MTARDALAALSRRLHAIEPAAACLAGRQGFGPVVGCSVYAQKAVSAANRETENPAVSAANRETENPAVRLRPPLDYAEGDEPFGYGEEEPPPLFTRAEAILIVALCILGAWLVWHGLGSMGVR